MASRFGGVANYVSERAKQKRDNNSIDALVKKAQINELGYDIQESPSRFGGLFGGGQTLVQRPDFQSNKALERQKLMNDLDPEFDAKRAAAKERAVLGARREMFGGSASGTPDDQFIMDPAGRYHANPLKKPLSDAASSKLSAAQQSLENIQHVKKAATPERFGEMKSGFSKIRMGNRLGVTNPESIPGALINAATFGLAKLPFKTNDDQKNFENNISTLIEGQLRARTGAAAPQQEIDREVSRILSSDDSLQSFINKLSNAEKFVLGISEGIRPGSTARFGQPEQGAQVPEWVPQDFDYAKAKSDGWSDEEIMAYLRQ